METKDIVEYKAKDGQMISLSFEIVKKYLVRGNSQAITSQELIFFMGICKSKGLNPFKQDCYLVKYGNDPAAIIQSIDYFRARAKAQPDCVGWCKGIIVKDKQTGEIRKTNGFIDKDEEILVGGWFRAKPIKWETPCDLEVNLSGYIKKTKDGRITKFWSEENQPSQIAKVAESQGLRLCWPDEFQGIYSDVEILEDETMSEEQPKVNKKTYQPGPHPVDNDIDPVVADQSKFIKNLNDPKSDSMHLISHELLTSKKKDPQYDEKIRQLIDSFKNKSKKGILEFAKEHSAEILAWPNTVFNAWCDKFQRAAGIPYPEWTRKPFEEKEKEGSKANHHSFVFQKKPKAGTVNCPQTGAAATLAYCQNARGKDKPCEMYANKECLERWPEE